MMLRRETIAGFGAAVLASLLTGCGGTSAEPFDPAAYSKEIEQWREQRAANLTAEDGWTTLVGLHWLAEGDSRVGSDPTAEVPLPEKMPPMVGTISLEDGKAHFKPVAGMPLQETDLIPDSDQDPNPNYTVLKLNTVRFYLIERGGKYGIRVKDAESPARTGFHGLTWYPVDPQWRVEAKFTPEPHHVSYQTEVGVTEEGASPGYLEFDREGQHFKLDVTQEDDELFVVIRDQTSGKSTYAAARFIYTKLPSNGTAKEGTVLIDFNKAYNPPCVFTDYATCPLPPPSNRLALNIEAGEKTYEH